MGATKAQTARVWFGQTDRDQDVKVSSAAADTTLSFMTSALR